jgi:hypothetical protein
MFVRNIIDAPKNVVTIMCSLHVFPIIIVCSHYDYQLRNYSFFSFIPKTSIVITLSQAEMTATETYLSSP